MTTPSPWKLPNIAPPLPRTSTPRAVKPRKPLEIGARYGQWTIRSAAPERPERHTEYRPRKYYVVQCSCGKWGEVARDNLVNGLSKSCGCARGNRKG